MYSQVDHGVTLPWREEQEEDTGDVRGGVDGSCAVFSLSFEPDEAKAQPLLFC